MLIRLFIKPSVLIVVKSLKAKYTLEGNTRKIAVALGVAMLSSSMQSYGIYQFTPTD